MIYAGHPNLPERIRGGFPNLGLAFEGASHSKDYDSILRSL